MDRDLQSILVGSGLIGAALILQSVLLRWVAIHGVKPDLALIILIFLSIRKGSQIGQLSGFIAGIAEDLISLSPLGFHAFWRTTLGFLYGLTLGNLFVDPIVTPVLLVVVGTLLKGVLSSILVVVFSIATPGFSGFGGRLWIELGYNAGLAPFVFYGLSQLKSLKARDKELP